MRPYEPPDPSKENWRGWETEYTNTVIASINSLRGMHGLTVKELAARLEFFGWPVGVATLNGILGGKKRTSITVGELLLFARALNAAPLYLLLGLPDADRIPEGRVFSPEGSGVVEMYQWLSGNVGGVLHHPFPADADDAERNGWYVNHFTEHALGDMGEYAQLLKIIKRQNAVLIAAGRFKTADVRKALPAWIWSGEALRDALDKLRVIRDHHRGVQGFPLPDLREGLEFIDEGVDTWTMQVPLPDFSSSEDVELAWKYVADSVEGIGIGTPQNDD